jgi:tetratricopeptide (TPR) repeat protein
MRTLFAFFLVSMALPLFADNLAYEKVEDYVFKENTLEYVYSIPTNTRGYPGQFQRALVNYRIGEMTTNSEYIMKAVKILESLTHNVSNVYTFGYLGVCYASLTRTGGGRIRNARRALNALDTAVGIDPAHYLPRFYRGMMLVFMPAILGGNEEKGVADLDIVVKQIPSINRNNDYKAFLYFFYAYILGERLNRYSDALIYIDKSLGFAEDEEFRARILERKDGFKAKL